MIPLSVVVIMFALVVIGALMLIAKRDQHKKPITTTMRHINPSAEDGP